MENENTTIAISDELRHKAKIKASILDLSLKEYIERLVEVNTQDISDIKINKKEVKYKEVKNEKTNNN